ncbi:MAG TPA: hypothetical protein VFU93_08370 [Acidimicrobiales bacterium]|nr:hypothetical protein [Acidimicrobiales bacterium]
MLRRSLILLPILLVAACGRGGDGAVVAAPDPTTTQTPAALTATVDWAARTITVDGDVPFDVSFCDGEAPLLCITDDGTHLGVLELATFPEAVTDFDAWASSFYDSIAADRTVGCDPTYALDGEKPVAAPFAGALGVRYGFVGQTEGRPVERVLGYAINDAGGLRLLVANALADDACLARESELPLDVIDDVAPLLAAIAEGSRF